jgi:TonB family protein
MKNLQPFGNSAVVWSIWLTLIVGEALATSSQAPQVILDESTVTPLMRAVKSENLGSIKKLLSQNVNINEKDDFGWTALFYAVARGDKNIVKALLDKGADLNAADDEQYTPLMRATAYNHLSIVKLLIERKAEVNRKDVDDDTAMIIATRNKHKKIIEALTRAGALQPTPEEVERNKTKENADKTPTPTNQPRPNYTEVARMNRVQGIVRLRLQVDDKGVVRKIRVLAHLPYGLTQEAMVAAAQLRFKPAMKDGKAIVKWVVVEVAFQLR